MAKTPRAAKHALRWTPGLKLGLGILSMVALAALFAPIFLHDAATILSDDSRQGISAEHWMGTDDFGRDILARTLVASRLTLLMSLGATLIAVTGGILIGAAVWMASRRAREFALRLIEAAVAYPSLIFALIIAAILGPGSGTAIIAIGVAGIPGFARLTANLAASVSQRNYVGAARLLGVPMPKIIERHLLPNMAEPLFVMATSSFALSLLEISSLSFVGLGVQSPEFDFGRLLNEALNSIYTQPLQAVAPSIMLVLTGLGAMLVGDGLAATADPRGGRKFFASRKHHSRPVSATAAPAALLEVDNLTVTAPGGQDLVKGISFSIAPGQVLGLVGESGSGKSMTAMAVAGLLADELAVSAHTLRLGSLDLLVPNAPRTMATSIGLVYQDPGSTFNPALRMGGQLTEVSRVHLGASRTQANRDMVQALDAMSIRNPELRLTQHPHQLSGGMLQRSMIAASTVSNPVLLIADEPTTALDVTVQADVLRKFRKINKEKGTALLFISHDIGVVQELCDEVLVMHGGRILERLSGAELKAGHARHPYTRALLAATPAMDGCQGKLKAARWLPEDASAQPVVVNNQ
ncbi:dipeptide/oligopeptide/nickel ABC transporter permease/ATP-binding protein [Paenarthrobacter sp. A20]|uniref:dipeptide/oligopeptide/nickel ABC transporter permease/ATP-binding protein n=1 Tax=Paenarthrobacter sp. A20 TaxID=2817891 RepID=UPI0020A0DF14|nr:dipeptide/oligopeptide/nickel ABC transporter permease/ATP-binding protein [Paenarthrobacter sp. A20]MCP1415754.1 ABC-type dipeptide/oligopeptide/nickel transport system ATPase component/ABC-type dipeptide/oligopeptide/nickel transport system permease subunit [Paenarthrobacter sp. A20]